MRALSVKQPFAALIAAGVKTYEIRGNKTNYRGELLICSTLNPLTPEQNRDIVYRNDKIINVLPYNHTELPNGVIVCRVNLVNCIPFENSLSERIKACLTPWASEEIYPNKKNLFAWVLENPQPVEPKPIKGKLGIFEI